MLDLVCPQGFRDEKTINSDAKRCVMVKAAPAAPLVVAKAEMVFEIKIG
jgi:hypothetical protein